MAARTIELPLVVIVGPTASGKTSLAIKIAQQYDGEIICADSRTVYKEMDIGTAKPTAKEQAEVQHWGIDLIDPDKRFTVAEFKQYADQKITEIRRRGRLPIVVGGTGLYVDSLVFDFNFGEKAYEDWRHSPRPDVLLLGIAIDKEALRHRIATRAEQLFANGVVEEATTLGKKYGWTIPSMTGNIYPTVHSYLKNETNLKGTIEKFTTEDWHLAKRQMTWLRPNPFIEWCTLTEASDYFASRLAD